MDYKRSKNVVESLHDQDNRPLLNSQGHRVHSALCYVPQLYLIDVGIMGPHLYVIEEHYGIQEELISSCNKKGHTDIGRVVRLKSREECWPSYFLISDFGEPFTEKPMPERKVIQAGDELSLMFTGEIPVL